jgi:hypothetical protein
MLVLGGWAISYKRGTHVLSFLKVCSPCQKTLLRCVHVVPFEGDLISQGGLIKLTIP